MANGTRQLPEFYRGRDVWPIMPGNVTTEWPYLIAAGHKGKFRLFGSEEWFEKSDLFQTQGEAEAECDRRNAAEKNNQRQN